MASVSQEIPEKDPAQLKRFWLDTAGILVAIAAIGFLVPYVRANEIRQWPPYVVGVAALLSLCAFILPAAVLRVMYRSYMLPFVLIGLVMSRVVLGILFFLIVFPVGVLMRASGKDPMRRTLDKKLTSYRNKSEIRSKESVEAPF